MFCQKQLMNIPFEGNVPHFFNPVFRLEVKETWRWNYLSLINSSCQKPPECLNQECFNPLHCWMLISIGFWFVTICTYFLFRNQKSSKTIPLFVLVWHPIWQPWGIIVFERPKQINLFRNPLTICIENWHAWYMDSKVLRFV